MPDCGNSNALARNTLMGEFFKFSSFTTFYVITIPMYWEIPEDEPSNHGAWNRNQIQHLLCFIQFGRLLNESTILILTRITRTIRTPASMITHIRDSYQIQKSKQDKFKITNFKKLPKIQNLKFCMKVYMQHTFWSCLIRCINMKWIQPEL